jgi:hypothetical protein
MRGSMILFQPGREPELREFDRSPTLEELQASLGGYLQTVPFFDTIGYGGTVLNCVAFCNEHAKLDHLPTNEGATIAWERALQRCGYELRDKSGALKDWLVGQVILLFGDREFMETL